MARTKFWNVRRFVPSLPRTWGGLALLFALAFACEGEGSRFGTAVRTSDISAIAKQTQRTMTFDAPSEAAVRLAATKSWVKS